MRARERTRLDLHQLSVALLRAAAQCGGGAARVSR
jgi:hypothetical protein